MRREGSGELSAREWQDYSLDRRIVPLRYKLNWSMTITEVAPVTSVNVSSLMITMPVSASAPMPSRPVVKARVDQACDAPTLELMLIKDCSGHPKTQTAPVGIRTARQPEIDTALLESVFGTVVARVAADHVERFNCRAGAIAAYCCTSVECISHLRFKWSVGNHLHRNGLIAAQDVHAIQFSGEQIKILCRNASSRTSTGASTA